MISASANQVFYPESRVSEGKRKHARVVFALGAITTERRLDFQLKGLVETGRDLNAKGFAFDLIEVADSAGAAVAAFATEHKVSHVVCDFSPLREAKRGTKELVDALPDEIGASLVDAHNVVPVWAASPKQEVGARTLRKKITDQLPPHLAPRGAGPRTTDGRLAARHQGRAPEDGPLGDARRLADAGEQGITGGSRPSAATSACRRKHRTTRTSRRRRTCRPT